VWAKQRHNAHYQPGEVTIRYRFHPRCGEAVIATGRVRHGDEVSLIIRQPDGTLAQLPVWMTEERAAEMTVTEIPLLSLACLRELRLELDAGQSLVRDDSGREGDKHATSETKPSPSRSLCVARAARADSNVRANEVVGTDELLLVETLAVVSVEASDEDHS
jgi:hypothetical protein